MRSCSTIAEQSLDVSSSEDCDTDSLAVFESTLHPEETAPAWIQLTSHHSEQLPGGQSHRQHSHCGHSHRGLSHSPQPVCCHKLVESVNTPAPSWMLCCPDAVNPYCPQAVLWSSLSSCFLCQCQELSWDRVYLFVALVFSRYCNLAQSTSMPLLNTSEP